MREAALEKKICSEKSKTTATAMMMLAAKASRLSEQWLFVNPVATAAPNLMHRETKKVTCTL